MSTPSPMPPAGAPDLAPIPSSSFFDRISTWAAEHKAVVYTIAGIAVIVTGAGAVYYLTDSVRLITEHQYIGALDS